MKIAWLLRGKIEELSVDEDKNKEVIAAMAYNLGRYEYSSRFVSSLIVSRTAGSNTKNRAHDLKEKIIEKLKK